MRLGWITLAVLLVLGCGGAPEEVVPLDPEVSAACKAALAKLAEAK